jgi:LacI family transcriptional regulator
MRWIRACAFEILERGHSQMKRLPTIADVARRARVSIATASRVMNNSDHPVSEPTRRRVLQVIADMGFTPNEVARALATRQTCMVGVLVGDTNDPYFSALVRGIEDVAREHGYIVIVCNSDRIPEVELTYVKTLLSHRVAGLIFAGGGLTDTAYLQEMDALIDRMNKRGVGLVTLSEHLFPSYQVCYDNCAATRDLTNYLIGLGHRDIGLINGPPGLNATLLRLQGYRQALEAAGIAFDPARVISGNFRYQGGISAVEIMAASDSWPTAILASNDESAIGAMVALKQYGIRIPEDISLVGFDDILATQYVDPPLTTVRVPLHEMGAMGMRQLLRVLNGEKVERFYQLAHQVVERQSASQPRSTRRLPRAATRAEKTKEGDN